MYGKNMISTIAAIGTGGALGAILRHGVNVGAVQVFGHGFPMGTLIVNILGSFLMGVLIALFAHSIQTSNEIKLFLTTGFLGAFTTFSAFSLDFVTLYERGDIAMAGGYAAASVILSILALFAGLLLIRGMVA